ncbi:MAG: FadR family transcriptional regulator [Anaerolineae bacterium]|nr:FadR family transcriptional regulator [Anaerolineae bacterium]
MLISPPRTSVSHDVSGQIIDLVRSGKLIAGDRLPGERQLAEQLNVSRASVRAGVMRLVTMGLLESRPGSGTYVREPGSEGVRDALVQHLSPDPETLRELFELREIIESEAAARAAQRATPEQIERMRRWANEIATAAQRKDREGLAQADVEFHRQIVIATGNEVLLDVIDSIAPSLHDMRYASTDSLELLPGQRLILNAIEQKDSEAARKAMLSHLTIVRKKAAQSSNKLNE